MDLKKVKKLISLVESSNISALSLEEENIKIEIKKETSQQIIQTTVQPQQAPVENTPKAPSSPAPKIESEPTSDPNLDTITSPMVGTFYESPDPESPAFVLQGKTIQKGDIVCIVEAMKLFNEIESDISGTIEKICVKNGDAVEFGQPLFLVRPN